MKRQAKMNIDLPMNVLRLMKPLAPHCAPKLKHTLLALACMLLNFSRVQAEDQGSIRLPDGMQQPTMRDEESFLDPHPSSDTWAQPGHRPLGVTLDTYALTQEQIQAASGTGCSLVRLPIPMESFIEGAEPDWSSLDMAVSRLSRAGFEIMPLLDATTAIPEFYRAFCKEIAQRYGPTFKYYQILDNVNTRLSLPCKDYASLLASARTSIVLADADAVIVSGGIRGVDLTYLEMLDRNGGTSCYDILAFNLFPPPDGVEQKGQRLRGEHSLPYMELATAWGRAHGKAIWVTSLGVSTALSWAGVDQATQASILTRAPLYLGYVGVSRIILQSIQDSDPGYTVPVQCCGVLDTTGQPKASYYALRTLNRTVTGAYHTSPPFQWEGTTYQFPSAQDLFIAPDILGTAGADALTEYQVYNLPVFCFWFYAPVEQEYRLIYWLGGMSNSKYIISLLFMSPGETPLIERLRPIDSYLMLDNAAQEMSNPTHAMNMLMVEHLPLDTIPGVVRLRAGGFKHGN